jgi:hypothetical protein
MAHVVRLWRLPITPFDPFHLFKLFISIRSKKKKKKHLLTIYLFIHYFIIVVGLQIYFLKGWN